jgi:cobalt-zinc-cadmium efflux system outer membrane protein
MTRRLALLGLALAAAAPAADLDALRAKLEGIRAARMKRAAGAVGVTGTGSGAEVPSPAALAADPRPAPAAGPAGEDRAFDMGEALTYARDQSYVLQQLELELRAAEELRGAAGTYPALRVSAALNRDLRDLDAYPEEPYAGVTQPWDLFGNRRASRRVAGKDVELARLAIEGFEQRLRYEVLSGFRRLQYREAALRAASFSVRLAVSFLRVARLRRDAGTVPDLDVIRGEAELYKAQANRKAAEVALLQARASLGRVMGLEAWAALDVAGELGLFRLKSSADDLVSLARVRRVDLESLAVAAARLRGQEDVARRRRLPTLAVQLQTKDDPGRRSSRWGGLALSMPFWHGRVGHERRALELRAQAVEQDLLDRQRRMRIRIGEGVAAVRKTYEQLAVLQFQEIPKNARQLQTVERGYRAGGLGNLAVLEAQRRVIDVIERYLSALHDYHQARLSLMRETGMAEVVVDPVESSRYVRAWLYEEE